MAEIRRVPGPVPLTIYEDYLHELDAGDGIGLPEAPAVWAGTFGAGGSCRRVPCPYLPGQLPVPYASRYEDMKRNHSQMEKAIDGIIHAVSLVVETRDPYTAGHQRRVAELARCIAKEMCLSEWQTMGIYITGLLHDVGKVAVPAEILSKPGKISQYEFSIIKNHSQIGYDILQRIDFPWPVTRSILQHHERMDGSGYPGGLREQEIILEARIIGVADVVEAMSSHRPYRPAIGLTPALEEILRYSGILYDRNVVKACLNLLEKNEPEFEKIMEAAAANNEYTTLAAA